MDVTFHPHPLLPATVVCDPCGSHVEDSDDMRAAHREWHYIVASIGRG